MAVDERSVRKNRTIPDRFSFRIREKRCVKYNEWCRMRRYSDRDLARRGKRRPPETFIRWLSRTLFSRIRLAFGGNAGSFQNVTNGNDRPYQYRFSSNRPKRDTIQSAVQSFSRGMHRRRITHYYRCDAYCDVIKSRRHKRGRDSARR